MADHPRDPETTDFAPAARASMEEVRRQAALIAGLPMVDALLNSVLNHVLVLNEQRQIVFASANLHEVLPETARGNVLGKRPGEALGCTHSEEGSGCGTTVFCSECGAVQAILASLAGRKECQECRMVRVRRSAEESLDLLVSGSPMVVDGQTFSLVAVSDISHEKRRRALERIFFHDVINAAGAAEGRAWLLERQAPAGLREKMADLRTGVHELTEEILAQRDLAAAEGNDLALERSACDAQELVAHVLGQYEGHPAARGKSLRLAPDSVSAGVVTDLRLLRRVVGNMVKNALEASQAGETVTAGCSIEDGAVRLWVHNPAVMPAEIRLQVFNRSFTTKGPGRGLGTYSIRLLTERYLRGRAGFTSTAEGGTVFFVELPDGDPSR